MPNFTVAQTADDRHRQSRERTDSSSCPTIRSSRSSKATAPAATSGARACACSTPPSRRRTAASGRSRGWKSRRREELQAVQQLAARRDGRGVPRVSRRHQGPADDAGRRRHPIAERRAAADARPVRLPAAGALVQGRAVAGEASGEGRHGDLPREHRGHLRRHRVRRRHARGAEGARLLREGISEGVQEDPLRHRGGGARRGRRSSRRSARRSARSASRSASASSRSASSAPSAWCTARSATP